MSGYEATVAGVIRHFGMDRQGWIELCEEEGKFYQYLAVYCHDIEARMAKSRAYFDAAERLRSGTPPPRAGIPGMDPSAFPPAVDS